MFRTVAKNSLWLSASQIAARIIGFLYFIFLARYLGVADFGIYSFTLSFVYNFIPVADFGIERLVLRDLSRVPEKTEFYFHRLLPLRIFLAFGAYLLIIVSALLLKQSGRQIIYFALFGLSLFSINVTYLISGIFNSRERMEFQAIANILQIFFTVLIGVILVFNKLGLIFILFAFPLSNGFLALFFLQKSKKWLFPLKWTIDFKFWKTVLNNSWVFGLLTIIAVFYLRISVVVTGLLKDSFSTGLYGSAFKFIEGVILIPQSITLSLFPIFSRLLIKDQKKVKGFYLKGVLGMFLISLPFSGAMFFFSKNLISFFFGVDYLPALPVFKILSLSLILFFINSLAGNIIQNSKNIKGFLPLLFSNLIIELLLCLYLIPKFSLVGAAWAVVGGEIYGLFINNLFVYKILQNEKIK